MTEPSKSKKHPPKYYATRDWFFKHKEGFLKHIAFKLQSSRSLIRSYCLMLEEEGLLRHEKRLICTKGKYTQASYFSLSSSVREKPILRLSFLSEEEMAANGAYEPHMYVSEARHKKISYGPTIAEKSRERLLKSLENRVAKELIEA